MKKILASILAITMLMTTLSTCVIPASAENAVATGAFTEDFENYGSGNWLANMSEDGKTVGTAISGMSEKQWTIYTASGKTVADLATANASMEVVTEPGNEANKVLKLDAGNLASGDWFFFRRNANQGDKIARSSLPAKKMVVKAKFKLPAGYKSTSDTAMLSYNTVDKGSRYISTQVGANYGSTDWTILASGSKTYAHNNNIKNSATVPTEQWFEFKQVMDLTEHKTENHPSDTYRGFLDGTIYTLRYPVFTEAMQTGNKIKEVNSKYPQPSTTVGEAGDKFVDSLGGYTEPSTNTTFKDFGDYYGTAMVLSSAGTDTDYMYIDDLEVYYLDAFAQVGDAVIEQNVDGAWYKGTIKIPFNNELMAEVKEVNYDESRTRGTDQYIHSNYTTAPAEKFFNKLDSEGVWNHRRIDYYYKDLFTLKDAEGNVVEGGIADAYVEGKYLVIEPAKTLDRNVPYTVSASPLFMDVEGQGLNQYSKEQDIYTFNTAEDPFAHIIYDFDFENYDIDGKNWIENRNNTTDRYVVSSGVEEGTITVNLHSSLVAMGDANPQKITVVADPVNPDNKVLALSSGYATGTKATDPDPSYLTGWVTQIRFNANGKTGLSRSTDMGKGKKLVYKTKIFVPSDFLPTESSQLVNTASEGQAAANTTSGIGGTMPSAIYVATTGSWGTPMARQQAQQHVIGGKWIEWKHVADVSKPLSATHSDTVRAYLDDQLIVTEFVKTNDASLGEVFGKNAKYDHNIKIGDRIIDMLPAGKDLFTTTDYASIGNTWWGSAFNINPGTNTAKGDTFYLDDVEAFWIDALTFNTVNADDYTGGKVKINFNQKIREEVTYVEGKTYDKTNTKVIGLDGLFTIVDKDTKEVIEDAVGKVTLSADGKSVSVTPNTAVLEKGKDYSIRISEYLIDEYGQGLENNSTATYVNLHISTEVAPPFALEEISQSEVSGFAQGRDVKVTAKFSVAVDDESITNGIVVKAEDGTVIARNEGWTADYGTDKDGNIDYKTVVFNFGSLPTANYEVSANELFLAANGSELSSPFAITISKANDRIVLFEEDFETGYTVDANWVDAANEVTDGTLNNNTTYKSYTVGNHDWDVQLHFSSDPGSTTVTDFIGVVAAPEKATAKFSGNALKIYSNRGSKYSEDYISFRRNFNKLNGINFASEEYKGKKLVYEADLFADSVASDNSFFVPFGGTNTKAVRDYNDWKMLLQGGALRTAGHYEPDFTKSGAMSMYNQVLSSADIKKAATNYKIVVSMGENIDTTAVYVDGQLVQRPENVQARLAGHEWNDSARHEFQPSDGTYGETLEVNDVLYGVWGLLGQGGTTARTIYMDNFKAYLVDEFKVESVEGQGDVFNTAKGAVTYTFSKPVSADVAANTDVILLNEAGEKVEGGIASVTLSDADYKMTVKLSETLPGLTKYTIKLNETLKDADGIALSTEWKYYEYPIDQYYTGVDNVYEITSLDGATATLYYTPAANGKPAYLSTSAAGANKAAIDTYVRNADAMKMFTELTTSKATSLFADAIKAEISGNNVTTSVKFTNPEVAPMSVWCVVAAFGEYNEMLGCATVDVTEVEASSSTEEIPVTFEATNGAAVKSVKMFVWNSYEDMKPYQKAEDIFNK